MISEKNQAFKVKSFSIYQLDKKVWYIYIYTYIYKYIYIYICTLDCYYIELNTGTLPRLWWSSFSQQLTVKPIPFIARHFVWKVTGFLNLLVRRLTLLLWLIIYSNKWAILDLQFCYQTFSFVFGLALMGNWQEEKALNLQDADT